MTSAIVLLPLTFWAKNHLSSVLKATTPAAFNAAFDAFVAHDATAVINGAHVSREELKQKWQEQAFDEAGATVDFTGDVEVSAEKDGSVLSGFVGLFYTAIIAENIRVRDVPVERKITSSLNLIIEQDKSLPQPPHGPFKGGFFDGRRVTRLNQVMIENPVPFNLPTPPV